jgi:DNA-binding NarL/FixJ family response regulator
MTIRVLLADDQALLRHGFTMIINAQPDMEIVGEAADGAQAVAKAASLRPDVILMDIRMPGMDGIEATRRIVAQHTEVRVIILTTFDLDEYAVFGLRAGASGFLLKNVETADLLAGIRVVASGDAVLAPSTTRRLLDTFASTLPPASKPGTPQPDVLAPLTQRERQVFTEMASGASNPEIADRLTLSENTVKTHVNRVLAKLSLRDRVQVVIFAYENGLSRSSR